MSNNSMGQAPNMPTIGTINQGAIQYVNNPLQSPQLQSTSIQGSPSQHSPMSTQSQVGAKAQSGAGDQTSQLLSRPRLQELVREVDPTVQLDEEVEEMLLQLADDFIDTALSASCSVAKHRHAPSVELRDVQLHLGQTWHTIDKRANASMSGAQMLPCKQYLWEEICDFRTDKTDKQCICYASGEMNDSGICGSLDLVMMNCDHTNALQSQKHTDNAWRSLGRLLKNIKQ